MTGDQLTAQGRSQTGAALPPRNLGYRVLECGHPRVVAEAVPAITRLYCDDCVAIRNQAPLPLSPEHEYELAAARWRYTRDRLTQVRDITRVLLEEAHDDLEQAAAALNALCISPGIPAYTRLIQE